MVSDRHGVYDNADLRAFHSPKWSTKTAFYPMGSKFRSLRFSMDISSSSSTQTSILLSHLSRLSIFGQRQKAAMALSPEVILQGAVYYLRSHPSRTTNHTFHPYRCPRVKIWNLTVLRQGKWPWLCGLISCGISRNKSETHLSWYPKDRTSRKKTESPRTGNLASSRKAFCMGRIRWWNWNV